MTMILQSPSINFFFFQLHTSDGDKPNAVVMGKNSCDIPSVSDGCDEILTGTLLVGSHLCTAPISGPGNDSDDREGQDNSRLYFCFVRYSVKAGCLHCKDLVEVGSSSFKHSMLTIVLGNRAIRRV